MYFWLGHRLFVLFFCWLSLVSAAQAWSAEYRAAAGRVVISPPTGTYLAGYGRNRTSSDVADDLYAHVLLVSDEHQTVVLVTQDNIGITRPDILKLRAAVRKIIPGAQVVVSSTHTHAGPDVVGLWGPALWSSGRDEDYLQAVEDKIVALVRTLKEQRVPVQLAATHGQGEFEWVQNLSEPDLLDRALTVLRIDDESGKTIATVTNFACHPTVLGPKNTRVSADYVAGFYRRMAQSLPGEHIFLQGAIGGWVQPLQGNRSSVLAHKIGADIGARALQLLERAQLLPDAPIVYREQEVDIPLENSGFRLLNIIGILDRPTYRPTWWQGPSMRTSVAYFRFGNMGFVTHPGETSPYYSLATRQLATDEHVMVLGLTQDALGYILKPDYFKQPQAYPHADYLTGVSIGPEAGPLIIRAVGELVKN